MSLRRPTQKSTSGAERQPSLAQDAARAKRARDHLARKRRRERERLERVRSRSELEAQRRRVHGIATPVLVGLALALGFLSADAVAELLFLRQASLEHVAIQGAHALSPETIARGAGLEAGQPLTSIDPDGLREGLNAEPWIASAKSLRLPTGTLLISVVERRAIARWHLDSESKIELVDQVGAPFPGDLAPGGPLPLVRGEVAPHGGLPEEALEILAEVRRHAPLADDPEVLTLHLPSTQDGPLADAAATGPTGPLAGIESAAIGGQTGYVLEIGEGGPRVLLGRRLFSQRVARLATLLEHEEATLQDVRWIDLRFADRAVLRADQPASG